LISAKIIVAHASAGDPKAGYCLTALTRSVSFSGIGKFISKQLYYREEYLKKRSFHSVLTSINVSKCFTA
jgi:hypothetical protein